MKQTGSDARRAPRQQDHAATPIAVSRRANNLNGPVVQQFAWSPTTPHSEDDARGGLPTRRRRDGAGRNCSSLSLRPSSEDEVLGGGSLHALKREEAVPPLLLARISGPSTRGRFAAVRLLAQWRGRRVETGSPGTDSCA